MNPHKKPAGRETAYQSSHPLKTVAGQSHCNQSRDHKDQGDRSVIHADPGNGPDNQKVHHAPSRR